MRIPDGLRLEDEAEGRAREQEWRATGRRPRKWLRWALVVLGVLLTAAGLMAPPIAIPVPGGGPQVPSPAVFMGITMFAVGSYWIARR